MQTSAADHRWLALLGVLLFPLLNAIKKAFPNIPSRFMPLVSLLGGLAAGFGHALAMGADLEGALWSAALGMAGGGTSVALYEATKKRTGSGPPSSAEPPTGQDGPATPKSPRPGSDELSRAALAWGLLVVWAFAGTCFACSASDRAKIERLAVPACEAGLIHLADAAELAPLCVTAEELAAVLLDLAEEQKKAGTERPTQATIHRRVAARRARVKPDAGS